MKVINYLTTKTIANNNKTFYESILDHIKTEFLTTSQVPYIDRVEVLLYHNLFNIFDKFKENEFKDFIVENENTIETPVNFISFLNDRKTLITPFSKTFNNFINDLVSEHNLILTKIKNNANEKYLVSENTTTSEGESNTTATDTKNSTLENKKINQGTPITTDVYAVGNTLSGEKTNQTNTDTIANTSDNINSSTTSNVSYLNVNYFLSLENYQAFYELENTVIDLIDKNLTKFFLTPLREVIIDTIDFDKVERIRGIN